MRLAQVLCLALISALVAIPAQADIVSLRCTVTPLNGAPAYSGYVWADMSPRKAYEQWYRSGAQPPVTGPFRILITPNEMAITETLSVKAKVHFRIDRDSGAGTAFDGRVLCVGSDVALPIKIKPEHPAPPAKH